LRSLEAEDAAGCLVGGDVDDVVIWMNFKPVAFMVDIDARKFVLLLAAYLVKSIYFNVSPTCQNATKEIRS